MDDKVISEINNLIITIQAIINNLQGRNKLHLVCEDTIEKLEELKEHIQELDHEDINYNYIDIEDKDINNE